MKITHCRMCENSDLYPYLNLGFTPLADRLLSNLQLDEEESYFPLVVVGCQSCGLNQLNYVVDPKILYQKDYPYDMSTTMTGGEHWDKFAQDTVEKFSIGSQKLVVDIGSNSGSLLQKFQSRGGMRVLGVDPAPNIAQLAIQKGIPTVCDFFNLEVTKKIVPTHGKAAIITGTNVFAHIDDLKSVMEGVQTLLQDKGVFIFESPYLVNLRNHLEYDTIYHEHLSYLSIKPVAVFVKKFGMEIIDVMQTSIHGGSIRVFIARVGSKPISPMVSKLIADEEQSKLYDKHSMDAFAAKVISHKNELFDLLYNLKKQGKRLCGVSAPAKGMTLLNYCGIGTNLLDFVTEKNPLKIGRYTPGAHIPIVADDNIGKYKPDYALLLAWNFAPEIMKNLYIFKKNGGKFIIPIPKPTIV